ncbi:MAG: MarR family winged helix-turn-helix transcriptional regulator [Tepidiformaceae bacterium]
MDGKTRELRLAMALYRTTNALVRQLDRRLLRDHDVTFIQAITLMAIGSFVRPQPNLVATFLSQQSQTVTGVLDRLERAGHVHRFRDLDDRRAVRLELTDSGRRLADAAEATLQRHASMLFGSIEGRLVPQLTNELEAVELSIGTPPPE